MVENKTDFMYDELLAMTKASRNYRNLLVLLNRNMSESENSHEFLRQMGVVLEAVMQRESFLDRTTPDEYPVKYRELCDHLFAELSILVYRLERFADKEGALDLINEKKYKRAKAQYNRYLKRTQPTNLNNREH